MNARRRPYLAQTPRLLLLSAALLAACGGTARDSGNDGGGPSLDTPLLSGATATPTPFAPATATPTPATTRLPAPTAIPTFDPSRPWGNFPAPVEASAIEIPPPADPIAFDPNVINILVLGSDARPYQGGYRTDTLMVVSLDPRAGTATLFSVPRDLYVFIPGWRMDRVNTADPHGGFEVASQTILYNFGIPVHHYARMNFAGFTNLIDSLGGINVEVTDYLYDECGGIWHRYAPGTYTMDGFTALCYVRMRKGSSDFDRLRRQQEVMQAIFRKVLTLDGLRRVPDLYEQYRDTVETDIGLTQALALIPLAAQLAQDGSRISRLAIDPTMAAAWRVPYSGAAVLLPDRIKIDAMLRTAFGS